MQEWPTFMAKKSKSSSQSKSKSRAKPSRDRKSPKALTARPGSSAPRSADPTHIEVIVRGLLLRGQQVLLCENTTHGYFYLPGGHIEFSESAASALRREFLEETGEDVRVGRLLLVDEGVFSTRKRTHHEINLVFHVEQARRGKELKSKEDGLAFRWADLAAVPELDIRPLAAKAFLAAGAGARGSTEANAGAEWISAIQEAQPPRP